MTRFVAATMIVAMSAAPSPPSPEVFRFHCEIETRFRDLDAMSHVNNAAYFTYFEVARTGYMKALGHVAGAAASLADLFPFIVAQIRCRFLAPAGLGDRLNVHLRTTRLGSKSFDFEYLIEHAQSGQAVAAGESTQVYYDYAEQRTMPIPDRFRQRVEQLEQRSFST